VKIVGPNVGIGAVLALSHFVGTDDGVLLKALRNDLGFKDSPPVVIGA
jgi:hypothetical protein